MYCKYCGKEIPDDSLFCPLCGSSLVQSNLEKHQERTKSLSNTMQNARDNSVNTFNPNLFSKEGSNYYKPKDINRKKLIEWIKSVPIDIQAEQVEEKPSCVTYILIQFFVFLLGAYYMWGSEFIFHYEYISPFIGLLIFNAIGVLTNIILYYFYNRRIWGEYNLVIKKARWTIEKMLKTNKVPADIYDRLRKQHIERKLKDQTLGLQQTELSGEEFEWHSSRYCWGCGNVQINQPIQYIHHATRQRQGGDGGFRKYWTEEMTAPILLCPDCYARLRRPTKDAFETRRTKFDFNKIPTINKFLTKY